MKPAPILPPGARQTLEREGWLVVPRLLDAQTLEVLLRATAALEQTASAFTQDTVVQGVVFEVQSASGRKGESARSPGALRKIGFPSKGQPAFSHLRRDERVLSALEQCGLREPSCHVDQVNLKLPRYGTGFPFHQDARFVVGATQGRIERQGGLNMVIALDSADAGNGGFEVLGRTHTGGLVEFSYDTSTMNEGVFDERHRTLVALEPGDALFFHPHLAHGSGPNPLTAPVAWWRCGSSAARRAR